MMMGSILIKFLLVEYSFPRLNRKQADQQAENKARMGYILAEMNCLGRKTILSTSHRYTDPPNTSIAGPSSDSALLVPSSSAQDLSQRLSPRSHEPSAMLQFVML